MLQIWQEIDKIIDEHGAGAVEKIRLVINEQDKEQVSQLCGTPLRAITEPDLVCTHPKIQIWEKSSSPEGHIACKARRFQFGQKGPLSHWVEGLADV